MIKGKFFRERVILANTSQAQSLYHESGFGKVLEDKTIQLSLLEALYLVEKGKIVVKNGLRKLDKIKLLKKAIEIEPKFSIRYCVFKDMRNRGFTVKTALKFGADFRVYDRGIKPGQDHARWILYPVHESEQMTWYEFAAKNRVAHSTKKRLIIGIVDDENDVTYYECKWIKP
jgi:tRNA-intron endonuclease